MDPFCSISIAFPFLVASAILIFIEYWQIKKFNPRLYALGPRFIRIELPLEIINKLQGENIGSFSMNHGEWSRLGESTFLFYWPGRSMKGNPSPIPLKGRVIFRDGKYFAEGRLFISSLSFFGSSLFHVGKLYLSCPAMR
jgi:hypothetical protein